MQGHAKCEYRNGFVSGVMRLQRSPYGERSSRNHYGAAKKGELKFAPTCPDRIGADRPAGTREALPGTKALSQR